MKSAPADRLPALLWPATDHAYRLLLLLLAFNSFRPDRLLPGGRYLSHLPTLVLALLGIYWMLTKEKRLGNRQTVLFALFFLVMGLGTLFARNQRGAFEQTESLFLFAFLPYLYFVQFVSAPLLLVRYLKYATAFGAFFALLGIFRQAQISIPMLSDENDFCLLMNIFVPFAYYLGQAAQSWRGKLFWYGHAVLFVIGNITAVSRGGMLGLAAVCGYLFAKSRKKVALSAALGVIGIVGLLMVPGVYLDELRSIKSEGGATGTGKERLESWKAGWKMFLDHPVVGVGPANFGRWFADYYAPYGLKSAENMWGRVAHSLYVTLLSETGAVGAGLFTLLLIRQRSAGRSFARLRRASLSLLLSPRVSPEEAAAAESQVRILGWVSLGLNGAMIAFLVTGAFISVLWYSYLWTMLAYGAALENVSNSLECALVGRASGTEFDHVSSLPLPLGESGRENECTA